MVFLKKVLVVSIACILVGCSSSKTSVSSETRDNISDSAFYTDDQMKQNEMTYIAVLDSESNADMTWEDSSGNAFFVKDVCITPSGAEFAVENQSEVLLNYGMHYAVEVYSDGEWTLVPYADHEEYMTVDQGIAVKPGGSGQIEIDWSVPYGTLEKGKYRLIKEDFSFDDVQAEKEKIVFMLYFDIIEPSAKETT